MNDCCLAPTLLRLARSQARTTWIQMKPKSIPDRGFLLREGERTIVRNNLYRARYISSFLRVLLLDYSADVLAVLLAPKYWYIPHGSPWALEVTEYIIACIFFLYTFVEAYRFDCVQDTLGISPIRCSRQCIQRSV